MLDLETVTAFMLENFEQVQITDHGRHFLARCRLCGDSNKSRYKKRFNMDWNNGVPGWHCFNCGEHGSFYEIYGILKGLSYEDVKKELHKWDKDKIKSYMSICKRGIKNKKEKNKDNFNWIRYKSYELSDKVDGILQKRYIKELNKFYTSRKIPYEYKIFICHEGKYRNRIIIPIFDEYKNIIYFQARRIPGSGILPKYDNPVSPKELCILNRHKFNKEKYIIVHEGLIDAFMVGDQGTSCLGKEISIELLKELFKLTNKGVIVALDNDSEAYKALARFMKKNPLSKRVKYFMYPQEFKGHDDINSYVKRSSMDLNVYELITQNSVSYSTALVKLKLNGILK